MTSSSKLDMAGAGPNGFLPHVFATFMKVMIGYCFGSFLGLTCGMLFKMSKRLGYFFRFPIDILRTVPPIAFVPIFFMLLGRTLSIQVLVIVLYAFLTIVVNTMSAVENVPPVYQRYAMALGASKLRVYRDVVLPNIMPELLGAFRVGIIWAWGYQVIIEMMGSQDGIGKVFFHTKFINALDLIFIGVIWVVLLASVVDIILGALFNRATKWQSKINKGQVSEL